MIAQSRMKIERAQMQLLKTQKKVAERGKAVAEYELESRARADKSAKLRELRLAKEEADRNAAALLPVTPKKPRAVRQARPRSA